MLHTQGGVFQTSRGIFSISWSEMVEERRRQSATTYVYKRPKGFNVPQISSDPVPKTQTGEIN